MQFQSNSSSHLVHMNDSTSDFENAKKHFLIGLDHIANEQWAEAEIALNQSLLFIPDRLSTLTNLVAVLIKLKKNKEAKDLVEQILPLDPLNAQLILNMGLLLEREGAHEKAIEQYEHAIEIEPGYAEAFYNRGISLQELKRFEESLASYDCAIAIKPNFAEAYSNRGLALQEMRRVTESLASYDRAIEIKPDLADAYWNKSLALLLDGDLKQGWDLYEWGWANGQRGKGAVFPQPLWLGAENLAHKTILLHAEQGLGDTIQFCRYAPLVKALGARVLLEVPKALLGLLQGLEGVDALIEKGQARPAFDYHCPLLSLPLAFKTRLETIPNSKKYIDADAQKAKQWKERLGQTAKLRIGVVWNGGFRPNQPEIWSVNRRRNIELEIFSNALNPVDAQFYSLQKGDPAESEIRGQEAKYWPAGNFTNYADKLQDFSDTAALIENLDLVVGVDTSTIHLAAAMGKPTWILNRFDNCWRWLLERDDSPWYDAARLYRQNEDRQWEPVLKQVAHDLIALTTKRRDTL
jgi:tetratricopeptide (TPR) repeat protein